MRARSCLMFLTQLTRCHCALSQSAWVTMRPARAPASSRAPRAGDGGTRRAAQPAHADTSNVSRGRSNESTRIVKMPADAPMLRKDLRSVIVATEGSGRVRPNAAPPRIAGRRPRVLARRPAPRARAHRGADHPPAGGPAPRRAPGAVARRGPHRRRDAQPRRRLLPPAGREAHARRRGRRGSGARRGARHRRDARQDAEPRHRLGRHAHRHRRGGRSGQPARARASATAWPRSSRCR